MRRRALAGALTRFSFPHGQLSAQSGRRPLRAKARTHGSPEPPPRGGSSMTVGPALRPALASSVQLARGRQHGPSAGRPTRQTNWSPLSEGARGSRAYGPKPGRGEGPAQASSVQLARGRQHGPSAGRPTRQTNGSPLSEGARGSRVYGPWPEAACSRFGPITAAGRRALTSSGRRCARRRIRGAFRQPPGAAAAAPGGPDQWAAPRASSAGAVSGQRPCTGPSPAARSRAGAPRPGRRPGAACGCARTSAPAPGRWSRRRRPMPGSRRR